MTKPLYNFNIRSRFRFGVGHEELYAIATKRLSRVSPPWGLKGIGIKPLPSAKPNHSTGVSYTRELGTPIKIFSIGFTNRQRQSEPPDEAAWDDSLIIDFNINHKTIDYPYLMREAFPAYIEAMGAYVGAITEDNVFHQDSSYTDEHGLIRGRPDFVPTRQGVARIWPANYWDRELCRRAFALTPEQVVKRLSGHVVEARILMDGALITYSYERVPDDQLASIDCKLRPLLIG